MKATIPYAVSIVFVLTAACAFAALYSHVMEALVKDWRAEWGEGYLPLYSVQLPPLKNTSNNPMVREGQGQLMSLSNTGMAATLDAGEPTNVHPKDKEPVADSLSRIALANVYGRRVEFSGPVYAGIKVEGSNIIVSFTHAEETGDVLLEQRVSATPKAIQEMFGAMPRSRIAVETRTNSPWVGQLLSKIGHEPSWHTRARVWLIGESRHEGDRTDARTRAARRQYQ